MENLQANLAGKIVACLFSKAGDTNRSIMRHVHDDCIFIYATTCDLYIPGKVSPQCSIPKAVFRCDLANCDPYDMILFTKNLGNTMSEPSCDFRLFVSVLSIV